MHKPKDYTLLALAIPVIISLGFNFGIAIENKAASKIIPAQSDTLQYVEYFKDGDIFHILMGGIASVTIGVGRNEHLQVFFAEIPRIFAVVS